MPIDEARTVLAELTQLLENLVQNRDALNQRINVIRTTIRRLTSQIELVGKVQEPENLELLEQATQLLTEFARRILPEQNPNVGSGNPTTAASTSGRKRKKSRKKKGKASTRPSASAGTSPAAPPDSEPAPDQPVASPDGATANSGRVNGRTKPFTIAGPVIPILRAAFSRNPLPETIEQVFEAAYGADWAETPMRILGGRGQTALVPLREEIARDPQSQVLAALRNATTKLCQYRADQVPPGYKPTATIRHLAELMNQHPAEAIEHALRAWGLATEH